MFPISNPTAQLDLLAEGLPPLENENGAICGKIQTFVLFHLAVAMASKEESSAWSQHGGKMTEARKTDEVTEKQIVAKFKIGDSRNVWHTKVRN